MILGTSSHAGKTTLVAALCRLFADQGIKVTPFKSQNMSLNSFATLNGEEIARSTAVQAFAARQEPSIHMNPILLKPKNDQESQVIFHGKVIGSPSAQEYFFSDEWYERKLHTIETSIQYLKDSFDLIIAEGAGSFAEPNFRTHDLVNMGLAHLLDADVYLVVDIDKGGVFADILGSLRVIELVSPEDKQRIKGILINKFRGDLALLQPAIHFITAHTGIPVIGIIPYISDLHLEEEDRIKVRCCENPEIDIAVIYLPHIANGSDFNPLSRETHVQVRFVRSPEHIGAPDLIILPGTKNPLWDLDFIRRIGWEKAIRSLLPTTPLMGICGGFEMMGKRLYDPGKLQSSFVEMPGFGFFDFSIRFKKNKKIAQVRYQSTPHHPFKHAGEIAGYEIHCGEIEEKREIIPLFTSDRGEEGAFCQDPFCFGTFIHDLFKNALFTRELVNYLRTRKSLPPLETSLPDIKEEFDLQLNALARVLQENLKIRAYQEGNKIILEPLIEIPVEEHWLYKNPEAMASLIRGLGDIKKGKVSKLDRDFSRFLDDKEI